MEPTDQQPPDDRGLDDEDRRLDALLAQARWPAPGEASTRRLEATWARVSPARRQRRWIASPALRFAAAAAVLIAVTAVALLLENSEPKQAMMPVPRPVEVKQSVVPLVQVSDPGLPEDATVRPVFYEPHWREPTARERLAMCAEMRRMPRKARAVETQPTNVNETVEPSENRAQAMLREGSAASVREYLQLVGSAETRHAALNALDGVAQPPVEAIFGELSNPRIAIRIAAARALARINGPETVAILVNRVGRDVDRREALAALLCTEAEDAQAFIAEARASRHLAPMVRSIEIQLQSF